MAIYNHVKSSLEPCGTFRETRRWENIVPSEITQKPPLCGLTFLTVDRLREREKAELTKGSGIVLSIESLSDSRAPKAVYRVVAYSASPSVIRSHLRAWGMISRSSPSVSALADFPTPRVSLVSTSKGRPALSRSDEPIIDPGPVAERSPGVVAAHYARTRISTLRLIERPTGLPNGMSIGLDTEISRANRSHRCQRRRGLCHGDRCRRDLRSV